jgi:HAMP domain-containing protein
MQINQSTLESGILAAQTQIVTSSAERVESFLGGTSATLRGMARFQGLMTNPDEGQRSDLLIPFLDSYNSLLAVRVLAADGRQVAEVGRGAAAVWELLGLAGRGGGRGRLRGRYIGAVLPLRRRGHGGRLPSRCATSNQVPRRCWRSSASRTYGARRQVASALQAGLRWTAGVLIAHRDLDLVRARESLADVEIVGYLQAGQTLGSVPFRDRAGRQMLGAYDLVPVSLGASSSRRDEATARSPSFDIRPSSGSRWARSPSASASFARGISRPIQAFAERALAISRGDFKGTITARSRNEIGQLADTFNHMTRQLDSYDKNMRELFLSTIKSLAAAIDAKDPYTRGHSERVALFSVAIARELGIDEKSIERVQIAACCTTWARSASPTRCCASPIA